MWVKVISRFKHRDTGEYHDPGKSMNLPKDYAKHLVAVGCAEVVPSRKPKQPKEDKAKVSSEDKGAEL